MREEVWTAFQDRFAIPRVLEFYAATEGSFSLYNVEGRPGAIGRVPPFLAHRFPAAIVRHDPDGGSPLRDAEGRCVPCAPDEVGEAIGRIADADGPGPNRFEGYTRDADSEAKVLRDVFAPGDAWFRTGDLMRRDAAGFFYFVDRVGDTFRWKGENVSTGEVSSVLAACTGVQAAAVYGVALPGCEGRAGMAALATGESFDLERLHAHLVSALPPYARPVLLRLMASLPATGTFKLQTQALQREGYDPAEVGDLLFLLDHSALPPAGQCGLCTSPVRRRPALSARPRDPRYCAWGLSDFRANARSHLILSLSKDEVSTERATTPSFDKLRMRSNEVIVYWSGRAVFRSGWGGQDRRPQ